MSRDDFASFGVHINGETTLYPLVISPDMGMKVSSKEDQRETIDVDACLIRIAHCDSTLYRLYTTLDYVWGDLVDESE